MKLPEFLLGTGPREDDLPVRADDLAQGFLAQLLQHTTGYNRGLLVNGICSRVRVSVIDDCLKRMNMFIQMI